MDNWYDSSLQWYTTNLIIGSVFVFMMFSAAFGLIFHKRKYKEESSEKIGQRHGNGTHVWQVVIGDNKHVVTLKAGKRRFTLTLDGNVIESGIVLWDKVYNFWIDIEPALLTSLPSEQHDYNYVHKLYISGKQIA